MVYPVALGPLAQWSELAAHTRLVAGSSPAGPTTPTPRDRAPFAEWTRSRVLGLASVQCSVQSGRSQPGTAWHNVAQPAGAKTSVRGAVAAHRAMPNPVHVGSGEPNRRGSQRPADGGAPARRCRVSAERVRTHDRGVVGRYSPRQVWGVIPRTGLRRGAPDRAGGTRNHSMTTAVPLAATIIMPLFAPSTS